MGKKAKEHRKKVQLRNERLKLQHKKITKELQEQFQKEMEARVMRQKALYSKAPLPVYASTGDFVAQNYEEIFQKGGQDMAQKLIDSTDDGPKFR